MLEAPMTNSTRDKAGLGYGHGYYVVGVSRNRAMIKIERNSGTNELNEVVMHVEVAGSHTWVIENTTQQ
jgi:hypothetical protein